MVYITLSAIFAVLWIVATVAKGLGGPGLIPLALWLAVAKDAQLRAQIARGPGAKPTPEAEPVITRVQGVCVDARWRRVTRLRHRRIETDPRMP
jgi:hypothetical protein